MKKSIVDPKSLTRVQRILIRTEYEGWAKFIGTMDHRMALGACAALKTVFGTRLFKDIKEG